MKCERCGCEILGGASACPVCQGTAADTGFFRTSSVLISAGGPARTYHTVDEVPTDLRAALEESTQGENAATILFADPRGREELTASLPPRVQGRLRLALPEGKAPGPGWLTPFRRKVVLGVLLALTLVFLAIVFFFARKL